MLGQSERRHISPRRLLLVAIGQVLGAGYTAVERPMPERLAALLKKLEGPPPVSGRRISPRGDGEDQRLVR
jgi:hypothetical protein